MKWLYSNAVVFHKTQGRDKAASTGRLLSGQRCVTQIHSSFCEFFIKPASAALQACGTVGTAALLPSLVSKWPNSPIWVGGAAALFCLHLPRVLLLIPAFIIRTFKPFFPNITPTVIVCSVCGLIKPKRFVLSSCSFSHASTSMRLCLGTVVGWANVTTLTKTVLTWWCLPGIMFTTILV